MQSKDIAGKLTSKKSRKSLKTSGAQNMSEASLTNPLKRSLRDIDFQTAKN